MSDTNNLTQYRFAQARPQISAAPTGIFCNNKPIVQRDWYLCRESHANMAAKYSRCTQWVISELPEHCKVFKGSINFGSRQSIGEIRKIKNSFNRIRQRWTKKHDAKVEFIGKQHIVFKKGRDTMHYDYVLWTDSNLPSHEIKELILDWIRKSGGCRRDSSVIDVSDMTELDLVRIADYTFKNPTHSRMEHFRKRHALPATKSPGVIWQSKGFWCREPKDIETTFWWNGELRTKTRHLTAMNVIWREWLESIFPKDEVPEFTTEEYRAALDIERDYERIADMIDDGWDIDSPSSDWETFQAELEHIEKRLDGEHPIILYVSSTSSSSSKQHKNPVNSSVNLNSPKNTCDTANNDTYLEYEHYQLRGDGERWQIAIGLASEPKQHWTERHYPDSIVKNIITDRGLRYEPPYNPQEKYTMEWHNTPPSERFVSSQ